MLRLTTSSAVVRQALRTRTVQMQVTRSFGIYSEDYFPKKPINKESVMKGQLKEATGKINNAHHSNSEELIEKVSVIKVKGSVAVCDGGGGSLGHPVEYIQLELKTDEPAVCKYCGLKFEKDDDHHGHH